ncbi:glycosyltransferase family 2 protein [Acetobacterium carbinolicum]|uniref:glycosyltransferase family 2 protein n=1 Tax=Acetobacterium carbinolicum TaxID=52690 RepID=UPI0039BFC3FF
MKYSTEELIESVNKVNKLVEDGLFHEAYREFNQIDSDLEADHYSFSENNQNNNRIVANYYASFAYFLFSISEYSKFFEQYFKAQKYGYSVKKKKKFIYEAFIEPNIEEFKANYLSNLANIQLANTDNKHSFEELPFWLVTTGSENEYFLYNKETNLLEEKISFAVNKSENRQAIPNSDIFLVNHGSWNDVKECLENICNTSKNIYVMANNIGKLLSYFQGILPDANQHSKLVVFTQWDQFKYFFQTFGSFFPRNYIGDLKNQNNYLKLNNEIHKFRLEKKNRFGDRILLSICIPSYNRGHRAYENVLHCLDSEFDEEIEVVVSNNGTSNDTKDYYKKIDMINDSRLTYFSFEENKGMAANICKVAEIAQGKFILLLSDEDLVDLKKLEDLITILRENSEELGIIRVRSDKQGLVPYVGFVRSGIEALRKFMLTSNYLSGNIYCRKRLIENDLIEFIKNNLVNETCFYYPHMVWEIKLAQCSSILGLDLVLVREGKAEKTEFENTSIGELVQKKMPYYATFEGRIGQHEGFYEIIKGLEICDDLDIFRELYKKLCWKTLFLVSLSIRVYYKDTDIDIHCLMEETYKVCIRYLDRFFYGKKSSNKYKYTEDQKAIWQYFINLKSQI